MSTTTNLAAGRAAHIAAGAARRQALIEDVEFLLEQGESLPKIAERTGYERAASLARRLRRYDRPDLAHHFDTRAAGAR